MAFSEKLAGRVREMLAAEQKKLEEKRMFGGLCFMVDDKMCVGIMEDKIMVRLDPVIYESILEKEGCEPMDFTGKIMRGFVYVREEALSDRKKLEYWVNLALQYNKFAKSSRPAAKKARLIKKTGKKILHK